MSSGGTQVEGKGGHAIGCVSGRRGLAAEAEGLVPWRRGQLQLQVRFRAEIQSRAEIRPR